MIRARAARRKFTIRQVLPAALAAALAAVVSLAPARPARADALAEGDYGTTLKSLVAGPIGIVRGQTMRLNVRLPASARVASAEVRLILADGITGEVLATRTDSVPRGQGTFLDYEEVAFAVGQRHCIIGLVTAKGLTPVVGTLQSCETASGRTVTALPMSVVGGKGSTDNVIGLASGQTMRLNAWVSPAVRSTAVNLRLVLINGNDGRLLGSKGVSLSPGTGGFLDVTADPPLEVGDRACVVGIITSADGSRVPAGVSGVLQVYDTASGETLEATTIRPVTSFTPL